jgi:hypothetical protein
VKATRCEVPLRCAFSRDLGKYYYWDSFEAPLSRPELRMQEIYLGIFAHRTNLRGSLWWIKWLLILRGKIVSVFGLKGASAAQFNNVEIKKDYAVGEKIALFTLFSQDENEIVTGGDDKHLDFRVSVLKLSERGMNKVVLTTVVKPHNLFGKAYLFLILPFHRCGVKAILSNAVAAHRI